MTTLASICAIASLSILTIATPRLATAVQAMSMSPLQIEMKAAGSGSRAQFQVGNNSPEPLPVEIVVERLSYDEAGRRHTKPAGDDLAIFPITALIPSGSTQTFRIQYVGAPDITRSQSFLVNAKQLPLRQTANGRSRVQVVAAFGAILNVAPLAGASDLKLVSATSARMASGLPALSILVENPTDVHALIANASLRVGNQLINADTMRSQVGFGVVEPRKRRRFLVPLPAPPSGNASIEYRSPHR